ncbi:LIPOPROTEIN [Mycoplasmopsis pulmonis]|uniref:LIPOPROTEIN n=1 Tax=Mycoplasmopsis pulmonis (strain UAB CTIP) TaxID=272635 RepID=Q98PW4_MYCPU|nr:hypothetical protein [Mycoplasmopsis pulmonis]MDZ7293594.1 hypothetical protein [Mycoplasmopsis pulmonis]CAC13778.1 LIPOPROTEIN [Mycoplasmopsis pulmonis]VEU68366.1 Uncharacterised protein [Mycoplasmopsis pulmonis]
MKKKLISVFWILLLSIFFVSCSPMQNELKVVFPNSLRGVVDFNSIKTHRVLNVQYQIKANEEQRKKIIEQIKEKNHLFSQSQANLFVKRNFIISTILKNPHGDHFHPVNLFNIFDPSIYGPFAIQLDLFEDNTYFKIKESQVELRLKFVSLNKNSSYSYNWRDFLAK